MFSSVWHQRKSVSFFGPLIRNMHRGSCGSHFDEPPCPPQDPEKSKPTFSCESEQKKENSFFEVTGGGRLRCGDGLYGIKDNCSGNPAMANPHQPLFNKPECCNAACPDLVPRLDDMYYKISDKAKRRYNQTWVECPPPVKKAKNKCECITDYTPPIERRPIHKRPQTACNMMENECDKKQNRKCIRLILPGCRSRRSTFHCLIENNPRGYCPNRRCSPYPSYSECARKCNPPISPVECKCLQIPTSCEVWEEIEKAVRSGQMTKLIK